MNILFLYVSIGTGHKRVAEAIENAIKIKHPDWNTLCIDPSEQKFPKVKKLIESLYLKTNKYVPKVYDLLYDNEVIYQVSKVFVSFFQKINLGKFIGTIESFKPDIIVCTHAFPCGMSSILRKSSDIRLVAVPTDMVVHRYWVHKNVDMFAVATEESKSFLIKRGIPKDRIDVTGLPIGPQFSNKKNKLLLRKKFGLEDINTVLIMGGGFGFGPIKDVVKSLDTIENEFQMIVVTGLNKKLMNELKKSNFTKKIKILGYVDNIDEYMQMSDLLVTKPSGSTICEAAAKNLPMVLVKGVAGSEWENATFLKDKVMMPKDDKEFVRTIKEVLDKPSKLEPFKEKLKNFAKPDAAYKIVKIMEEL